MGKTLADVADAELKLLQALWDLGCVSARELAEHIYGAADATRIGTVQKLLQRLESKGLVKRDRREHVHRFEATVTRGAFAGRQLEKMADKLTEGSLVPFITHAVAAKALSKRERDQIRQLLDESEGKKRGGTQ